MSWLRLREAAVGLIAAGLIMTFAHFYGSSELRGLETASLDLRFRLRGPVPAGPETALVVIDDASLAALGRWPFSRAIFAQAVDRIASAGEKVIAFDILFSEPEETVSATLRAAASGESDTLSPEERKALQAALDRLGSRSPDTEFARAIGAAGNVLFPLALTFTGPREAALPAYADSAGYVQFDRSPQPPVFPLRPVAAVLPIPGLAKAAAGLGHVDIAYDSDGRPRYDYLALPLGADFIASLPVRAAATYLDVPWPKVAVALGSYVRIGALEIPTDRAMRLLINYRGPRGTFPTFSFADLVAGRVPTEALRGRIVLIGASFIGNSDSNAAPFGSTMLPGTERMANIIDTILHRDWIRTDITASSFAVVAAVLLIAALAGAAATRLRTRAGLVAALIPLVAWCGAAQIAFLQGIWLPLVWPLIALTAAMAAILLFRYWVVDREGRHVMAAFEHYLAPEFVKMLAAHPDRLRLGGEAREITLLFSDIRDFTSIAEQFKQNPAGLGRLINHGFLSPMSDLIMSRRGTIDKYMGDCIMAFWNAPLDVPNHADEACATALAMNAAIGGINESFAADGVAEVGISAPLHIGIGINTGECVVGNMGSERRFAYTALGDAVNLASRLEGQTKTYHVDVIIGEATRKAAPSWAAIELDLIEVKGKADAVRIYALLGDAELAQSAEFRALEARQEAMLRCYRRQDWAGARAALGRCRRYGPRLGALFDLYEERIGFYQAHPPGPSWDGVFVALSK
ncbi:MAG TPA: adenylate/guanylate cyclase domain-containing protein [Stellaceae bacterium]|nr:adenylate/guanylate cyclase domain-containing protein [Stellaceae bacterium]